MVNRTFIALASASTLFLAMGVAGEPAEEIFEYGARVVAEVTNVEGLPVEVNLNMARANASSEQLVEGHTVFHTMDLIRAPAEDIEELNVEGFIECRWDITGIKIPTLAIDRIYAECNVGGSVYSTDPTFAPPASPAELKETGRESIVPNPATGEPVLVLEHEYWTYDLDDPAMTPVKAYCWETALLPTMTSPVSGKEFNFVLSIPYDRLDEMGPRQVEIMLAEDFFAVAPR